MSQAPTTQAHPMPTATHEPHAAAPAKPKARDKAHDAALAFALLLCDWLHGDRHHQDKLMELALGLLDDLGEDGEEAKERLTAMPPPAKPAPTKAA